MSKFRAACVQLRSSGDVAENIRSTSALVREAAEVYVNAQRAGTIWHPPYELDVTPFLHAGENELRIVVGNTAVNEMAGSPLPDRSQLTARYGERFVDQGNELVQPVPSGLMGPIRLITRRQPVIVRTSP